MVIPNRQSDASAANLQTTLAVIGGGSAGFAAAWAAAKNGVETVLLEREANLGGTSTVCGVNCWEPAAGAEGLPQEFYLRLQTIPKAVGIYSFGRHCSDHCHNRPPFPGGENLLLPGYDYADTLRRCGTRGLALDMERCRGQWHGVVFEPEAWHRTAADMLQETGCCEVLLNTSAEAVDYSAGRVRSLVLTDGRRLRADYWIDASGALIAGAGLERYLGPDPRSRFQEPDAPEIPGRQLNGVSWLFRITPVSASAIEPLEPGIPAECWWTENFPAMVCTAYPNCDRNCNMLPTFDGEEFHRLGPEEAGREGRRRVRCYWHAVQERHPEFRSFRLSRIFPRPGVRESFRTVCECMLTENDLLTGLSGQRHDELIAVADHAMDAHGTNNRGCVELAEPYGIPYRCLIPKGAKNLLVAGKIAGFSSLAASSCRLSRTMMALGEAAGTAAAVAYRKKLAFTEVSGREVQDKLPYLQPYFQSGH